MPIRVIRGSLFSRLGPTLPPGTSGVIEGPLSVSSLDHTERMIKAFRNLFCVFVVLGALAKEVVQRYYSSPVPEPRLGRTVAALGTDAGTVYITPQTDRLFWALFVLCAVTFACWIFWPAKKKTTQVLPSSSVSRSTAATTLTYYWHHRKWRRYGFTMVAVALTSYVWVTERGNLGWIPRIVFLLIALWSLRMLIDYRTCIDTETAYLSGRSFYLDAIALEL